MKAMGWSPPATDYGPQTAVSGVLPCTSRGRVGPVAAHPGAPCRSAGGLKRPSKQQPSSGVPPLVGEQACQQSLQLADQRARRGSCRSMPATGGPLASGWDPAFIALPDEQLVPCPFACRAVHPVGDLAIYPRKVAVDALPVSLVSATGIDISIANNPLAQWPSLSRSNWPEA